MTTPTPTPTPMTEAEITEAEQLAEAATPGEWCSSHEHTHKKPRIWVDSGRLDLFEVWSRNRHDEAFVVAARTLVPRLAATCRALMAERDAPSAVDDAFDEIAELVRDGAGEWEYAGQVVRDVKRVIEQRDAALARASQAESERDAMREEHAKMANALAEAEANLGACEIVLETVRSEREASARGRTEALARAEAAERELSEAHTTLDAIGAALDVDDDDPTEAVKRCVRQVASMTDTMIDFERAKDAALARERALREENGRLREALGQYITRCDQCDEIATKYRDWTGGHWCATHAPDNADDFRGSDQFELVARTALAAAQGAATAAQPGEGKR